MLTHSTLHLDLQDRRAAPRRCSHILTLVHSLVTFENDLFKISVLYFGGQKNLRRPKKKSSPPPKKAGKPQDARRSIFILVPEADKNSKQTPCTFLLQVFAHGGVRKRRGGDKKALYSSSFREAPCHKFCMRRRIITQIHIFMPAPLLSTANLSAGEERKGRASCFLC